MAKNELAEDEYVVSRIAGMKNVNNIRYFLVEWEGYDLTENTWEEEENIISAETIDQFLITYKEQNNIKQNACINNIQGKIFLSGTYDPDINAYIPIKRTTATRPRTTDLSSTSISKAKTVTMSSGSMQIIKSSTANTKSAAASALSSVVQYNRYKRTRVNEPMHETVIIEKPFRNKRKSIPELKTLKNTIMNSVENKYPIVLIPNKRRGALPFHEIHNVVPKITIVNTIDNELPQKFIYIDQLKYTSPVQPPDPAFLFGCNCPHTYNQRTGACRNGCHEGVVNYDENGILLLNQGTAIYECNQWCACDAGTCKNRVVQKGRKIPLEIFKTYNKGWGVRSRRFIPKGTFIEEYIGEVITIEEGDRRGILYDKLKCSYLFDMDFARDELNTKYVIDSFVLGNVSRFFNHSCSPNLDVYAVYYDSADNLMHRLAFFAKRDIQKGEELCFDYNGRRDVLNEENNDDASCYACHCGSSECRKWIYY
ncbi:uncharacterized protein BX663DRAFT_524706 [Cokeromyces recurvatus]|uniref:uncharacterized protein n=1 Tax=Cokeromyces recurvatus TaxID=90255 RepID=UPI00221E5A61|nr:uncharacterized protein BX663DRAFT_524706 [Cokeromyces recurvatus]KAI7898435.1 hypothetical protein BX663DRAFT_524706 [Cokeromyces recurvatus]